jgi:DNA primase
MKYPPDLIERVREGSDIVSVVSEHVQLKRAGRTWKANCPFHQEKTPSFTVNPDRQIFKCFGCGEGGDVFRFLMEFEKMSFPEAVEYLANRAGIPLPQKGWTGPEEESVYPPLEWTAEFFRRELSGRTGGPAREYLERRGLESGVLERYGLGWAPAGWSNLLEAAGKRYSLSLLERAGLVIPNDRGGHYDRFRGRVMIPIRSALGRTIGFGARTLGDEEPKYLNSPETEVFSKGRVLYGLAEAKEALKETAEALVVEGYMDALTLAQAGFRQVVASCGTAFTEDQARVLRRYVDRVVLLFDGDLAGIRAAWKSAGVFLGQGLEVRVIALPDGHDPDSFVRERGAEAMEVLRAEAPGVVSFARETLLGRLEKREDLVKALAYLGARIDDPIRRRILLQEAAESFRFDEATLVREAARLRGEAAGKARVPAKSGGAAEKRDLLGRQYTAWVLGGGEIADDELLPDEAIRETLVREMYARWRALRAEHAGSALARLMDDAAQRPLVAELLAGDDEGAEIDAVMTRLRERVSRVRGAELRDAIRDAEARGDAETVERLLRELQTLKGSER